MRTTLVESSMHVLLREKMKADNTLFFSTAKSNVESKKLSFHFESSKEIRVPSVGHMVLSDLQLILQSHLQSTINRTYAKTSRRPDIVATAHHASFCTTEPITSLGGN